MTDPSGNNKPVSHRRTPIFHYAFPIRDDDIIMLKNIPRDLTMLEVCRMTAFLQSLTVDFIPNTATQKEMKHD